ncbi:hypothetical protein [Streptomyces sp. NPDC002825]|uniref:Rv1733c family protein n=1 Tax=Streptomyces sp. NPDC002825 TaxID=3154666 RepID=UPI0033346B50
MFHHEPSGPETTASGSPRAGRAALVLVLAIALICGAVAAAILWRTGARADRETAAHRHRVQATTTARSQDPPVAIRPGVEPQAVAPAVWEYPDHVRRSGSVHVPPRTPQGRAVTIWVDDSGAPARPPDTTADLALSTVAGSTAVAGAAGLTATGVLALVRRSGEGRRLAAWEREWERVEPVWSGRLGRRSEPGAGDE